MSGNQPVEPPPEDAQFPSVGQYDHVPGPGDAGYTPEAEQPTVEDVVEDVEEDPDDVVELDGDPDPEFEDLDPDE